MNLTDIYSRCSRCLALPILSFLLVFLFGLKSLSAGCNYNKQIPAVESARRSLKTLNYPCAEAELLDLLSQDSIPVDVQADAHILLGTVYFHMTQDSILRRLRVTKEFENAFQLDHKWSGTLDPNPPGLQELLDQAHVEAEEKYQRQIVLKPTEPDTILLTPFTMAKKHRGPGRFSSITRLGMTYRGSGLGRFNISISSIAAIYPSEYFSFGFGLGYHQFPYGGHIFPYFIDVRIYVRLRTANPFLFADYGRSLGTAFHYEYGTDVTTSVQMWFLGGLGLHLQTHGVIGFLFEMGVGMEREDVESEYYSELDGDYDSYRYIDDVWCLSIMTGITF
jgi:hypothetical protein